MTNFSQLRVVSALGVIMIFAWGSTFYLMAVLANPIALDTGWHVEILAIGISVGLFVSGLSSTTIGGLIEARGGRPVLATGMLLIAVGLTLLGLSHNLVMFFLAWVVLGFGMSAGLYDAAFSTLGRIFGQGARPAITQLTLWGGFASTVCWPLSMWLVAALGWRGACFAYAAFHLSVTLPIALLALPHISHPKVLKKMKEVKSAKQILTWDLRFISVAIAAIIIATMFTMWSVHFILLLGAQGYTMATAIAIGTVIGPAQVGARVITMLGGDRYHPIWTMIAAASGIMLGFWSLLFGIPAGAAMIIYGAGVGLWSIARGTLPLALFGAEYYALIMGRLATPMLIASSAAPTLGAWMIAILGPKTTLEVMAAASILPLVLAIFLLSIKPDPIN